ncbi:MAG: hypothetical protein HY720_23465 [Planctomycetes bacterium]|nr:hypothetical protein [Planctomycetota bacterium]
MNSANLTDSEIRARGWDALIETLGLSGALRFAMQTERGHGDWAALRHEALGALSVDDLLERMKSGRPRGRKRK